MYKLLNTILIFLFINADFAVSGRDSRCLERHTNEELNCLAYVPRYYYDQEKDECIFFVYGGCGGSKNNFSQKECEKVCLDS
ncbi:PI-actitoxin-Afv2a-like [Spodoptera litura]|uniref:PI-actitoxin-Afv2a-like n=1 Tax=Spodoptera litura TaxID=69820 RepID=A0A9J7DWL9_SPOLT|nr:PI-actitoxin-Afv2a-like [Spodoptera litura]